MPAPNMTYDSLIQDLKDYLERGDTEDSTVLRQMPRVVADAQRSLSNKLKIQGYIDVLTGTLTAGYAGGVVTKPEGWRDTVSFTVIIEDDTERRIVLPRSYEYMRTLYPGRTTGVPVFYCDYDLNHWLLTPAPDEAYPFETIVHRLPDLLSAENQQNFLTRYAPNLLKYESLAAMEPFLKNDDRLAVWKSLAKEEFDAINIEDLRRMVDRGEDRSIN